jgi:hypothetical protein
MRNLITAGIIASALAMIPCQSVYAANNGKFSLATGLHYSTGTYGGSQSTDILYIPVTGKYEWHSWDFKLTVPYLQITGPGNVIKGVGQTRTATTTARTTHSGLGDVVVAATHPIYSDPAARFMANLTGKIKFGTADNTQGLGTGRNDYALQSGMYKATGKLTTFGILGYRVYGSPAGYTLNNVFYGLLGGSYKSSADTSGGIMLNLRQRATAASSPLREVLFFASQKLNNNWKTQGYVLKGFSNASPDWGVGMTVFYIF